MVKLVIVWVFVFFWVCLLYGLCYIIKIGGNSGFLIRDVILCRLGKLEFVLLDFELDFELRMLDDEDWLESFEVDVERSKKI